MQGTIHVSLLYKVNYNIKAYYYPYLVLRKHKTKEK
jgi:hypothetical protein